MIHAQLNKELFFHLSRYHQVIFPPEILYNSDLPSLVVEDSRPFQIEGNKKYLKFQNNFEDDASNIKELIEDETEIMIINETKKIEKS